MPMYCPICEHHEESRESHCPKCGSPMRMSMLAGIKVHDDDSNVIRITGDKRPGPTKLIWMTLVGSFWVAVLAVGYSFLGLIGITLAGFDADTLPGEHPELFQSVAAAVTVLAAMSSVALLFRGAYLAQLVGAATGLFGSAAVLAVRLQLLMPTTWYEWFVLPAASVVCFLLGLRIAGRHVEETTFEFKPINSWDKKAQPSEHELPAPAMQGWHRLFIGIAAGMSLWNGLAGLLSLLLGPLLKNGTLLQVSLARVEHPLHWIACLAAGMVAGSGTRAGLFPGLLAGIVVVAMQTSMNLHAMSEEGLVLTALGIVVAGIGGVVGRAIFRPYRIFGNSKDIDKKVPAVRRAAVSAT